MAKPIYKAFRVKFTEAWYQLSEEEKAARLPKMAEARKKTGNKVLLGCKCAWSAEQWAGFGIDEFPDFESAVKFADLMEELETSRYFEIVSMLGTKVEMPS